MFKVILFISFCASFSFAENTFRFDIYGSTTNQNWNKSSPFNADNKVLEVPTWTHTLEFRPEIQLGFSENHSMIFRSRHFAQAFETNYENPDKVDSRTDSDSDLSDLFFSSTWSAALSTTIGLQNYQWGPAEIFSPTNPFFHFNNSQRSFFYKEKGRVLIRANWNPNPDTNNWSVIGLYEPIDNNTRYWIADEEFKPKSAIKVEYQFENPANAIAFIGGQGEGEKGFFGEYLTWSPKDGYSLYADMQHRPGRNNYVPVVNGLGLYDLERSDDDKIFTLAIFGFRWEGRVDFRQEFILNEAGYNKKEWKQAKQSATTLSLNLLKNSERFASPGLEFRTQSYSYTSIRIPDLGATKMASVSARWLSSLTHNSSALQLNYEYNWNDNLVLSAEGIQFLGSADGEFRILSDRQISLGFRWSY